MLLIIPFYVTEYLLKFSKLMEDGKGGVKKAIDVM